MNEKLINPKPISIIKGVQNKTLQLILEIKMIEEKILTIQDYGSFKHLLPSDLEGYFKDYIKEEVRKAALLYPKKPVIIGVGIAFPIESACSAAKEAANRDGDSKDRRARELEIMLRKYGKKFRNIKSINVETRPVHRASLPVAVYGNYRKLTPYEK